MTCIAISVDNGLLRDNTGCTSPLLSSTLYISSSKTTTISKNSTGFIMRKALVNYHYQDLHTHLIIIYFIVH